MGVHDGHRDRLRARFLKEGLEGFAPHNALELLLFYALPRCDTNALSHALLQHFGSLAGVFDASLEELQSVKGVGYNTAVLIKLIPSLGAVYMEDKLHPGVMLNTTEKAGRYFLPRFYGKTAECVYMAALDDKRKVLRCTNLEEGGIVNAVNLSIRKILEEAIHTNATGVLLAHNHPGGVALPSSNDKWATRQAYHALKMINVELVDHIVVAGDDFVSMNDSGFFDLLRKEQA